MKNSHWDVIQDITVVSAASMGSRDQYDAARRGAVLIDRGGLGRLVVSGADRRSYLHGLLTNDITALGPGRGCYAAYLTPQGRMITDLRVDELGDVVLVTLPRSTASAVLSRFDQFIFTEDVRIGDVSQAFGAVAVAGPDAGGVVSATLGALDERTLSGLAEYGNVRTEWNGEPVIVLRAMDAGVPGFELIIDAGRLESLRTALVSHGAVPIAPDVAETLRIEAGIPVFGQDMDEDTIPLEAGIEDRAISLTKGCYVGQEVIIRVLHRGHGRVARKLVGLLVASDAAPQVNAVVTAEDGREIGRVTSSTVSPALGRPIALAYMHRDFIEPGRAVVVNGMSGTTAALPFIARSPES